MLLRTAAFVLTLATSTALGAAIMPAPAFPAGPTVDTIQGVRVADPYRALEDGSDPKVEAWSDAQNERTRGYLDNLPGRAAVSAKLTQLIKAASPAFVKLEARGDHIFALYVDPARQQPALVMLGNSADPTSRTTLLDPNQLDPAGHTAIDWFVPSPDGSKVAVSLSRNGSEDGTLHVYEVASGKEIGTPISRVQYPTAGGAVGWTADASAFWYTRYPGDEAPEAERHFNQAVYFHRLGTDTAADPLILSATDGLPRTGEIFLDDRSGGAAVLASVQLGDGGQWQQFILREGQPALKVANYEDRIIAGTIARDGTVFGLSRRDAPMGKVMKLAAPYTGGFAAAPTIVPERKDSAIVDGGELGSPLTIAGDRLFVTRIAGGPSQVTITDLSGKPSTDLPVPPIAAVNEVVPLPGGDVLYSVSTYLEPTYFMRWAAASGATQRTALKMTSPISFADASVTRLFAKSKDGTKVPLNVIAKKGVRLDSKNPVLLYGYGGYGVNMTPSFAGAFRRLWLDAGGVYVIANVRGGGEYGDAWHRAGMLTKKQNVFDDFNAAGEDLIRRGYTSHGKLALMGGSNGGLLMGATITQHPALASAVISAVGIYDMVRVELDPNGAFNVTEFGTVKDPAQFRALYAYSPYHHVRKGTAYPAVLMLTGANDGRVNPLHSRKFAAALQQAQGADRPIFLRTSKTSGHGIGSSLDERILEQTDEMMFLLDRIGMDPAKAAQ
ncbi:MAG: prolyl oligopeptidase family serine peptidase [Sphingomicrobium sp.]